MKLPRLLPEKSGDPTRTDSVLFAVYAPFGTDETLSTYPDGGSRDLAQHPLYQGLLKVAAQGIHVAALIDRAQDDTYLVEIEAGKPAEVKVSSRWKQDMAAPANLAGFLRHAHQSRPGAAIVLALEGHGAGYLPEIDRRQLSVATLTRRGAFEWRISADAGAPILPAGSPLLPAGSPLLPAGSPLLPAGSPLLPSNHMPMSTWGLGSALKAALDAGVPKLSVIHFDNCFNMAAEVLHTVAPYADYAAGYPNYNFFTAGEGYAGVFAKLARQGTASAQELAHGFAEANRQILEGKGNHPTLGCVVRLARMHTIAECVDDLADALLAALRGATDPLARQAVVQRIRSAIVLAQQFDTDASFRLETPDQLTDLFSLANALLGFDFRPHPVHPAARALRDALQGIKAYGSNDQPWVAAGSSIFWNFSSPYLAMNIFLPDPLLRGLWDWRSPFYLDVNPDPTLPPVQPHIIDFVKVTDWVDFLIEYHKDSQQWVRLLPAAIPEYPVFNAGFDPKANPPCGHDKPGGKPNPAGAR
ncbi:clostripain-related cysteine peptidase [uncultured Piscinibacter sp.]|uniref:clostripain-related cysteine peptidase n=1 Tax=uncultured Piscinibacter sp. TaxID=1131835 RepID=UPI002604B977|nr:clostripain-related cysteine peptidase [uncultured Piscinibacter sp.]